MSQLGGGKGTAIGGGEEPACILSGAGEGVENVACEVGTCGGAEGTEGAEGGAEGVVTRGDTVSAVGEAKGVEEGITGGGDEIAAGGKAGSAL